MTETDVVRIYQKLSDRYPLILTNSLAAGFMTSLEFPVLKGTSSLGNFELFYDDVPSFAFYAMRDNGEEFAHTHFYSVSEAEQAVADFMEGKLTLVSFGQSYNI